jgi:hypothetical protein
MSPHVPLKYLYSSEIFSVDATISSLIIHGADIMDSLQVAFAELLQAIMAGCKAHWYCIIDVDDVTSTVKKYLSIIGSIAVIKKRYNP